MIFNGHTLETIQDIDDVTMANIQTMYADGLVGNYGILTQIATLTNGVFNYMRPANSPPYKLANVLGSAYDYIYPPLPESVKKETVNNSLLIFMSQAQGFDKKLFEVKHG
jgi:hypothetical protein